MLEYFLLFYFLVYFGAAFFLPTYRAWRKTSHNPLVFGSTNNAHDYIGKIFKLLMASLFYFLLQAVFPSFAPYLSAILLAGLGLNALFGWWWADSAAALIMVPIIIKEGIEALRGEVCCERECH